MKGSDLTGQRFGFLTVRGATDRRIRESVAWDCLCDCGNSTEANRHALLSGHKKSCGCWRASGDFTAAHRATHTRLYNIWHKMRSRCSNKNNRRYHRYGGRGISVCERWVGSFENFRDDVGQPPSERHSIDRIDNDGNYEPGNVRWSTAREQCANTQRNRVVMLLGRKMIMADVCRLANINHPPLSERLKKGQEPLTAVAALMRVTEADCIRVLTERLQAKGI